MTRTVLLILLALALPACGDEAPAEKGGGGGPAACAGKTALEAWSQVEVPGFEQTSGKVTGAGAVSSYRQIARTAGGATLQVRVTLAPCEPATCEALEPDPSRDAMRLRRHLNRKHASNPKLVWDAGHVLFAGGRKGLYLYTRSYMEQQQEGGGTQRLTAHFFQAWYHDGEHLIDFAVEARGSTRVTSDADLTKQMTPHDAKRAVQAIFAAYEGAFGE